jgi:hypothetical protein
MTPAQHEARRVRVTIPRLVNDVAALIQYAEENDLDVALRALVARLAEDAALPFGPLHDAVVQRLAQQHRHDPANPLPGVWRPTPRDPMEPARASKHLGVGLGAQVFKLGTVASSSGGDRVRKERLLTRRLDEQLVAAMERRAGIDTVDSPAPWTASANANRAERDVEAGRVRVAKHDPDPADAQIVAWCEDYGRLALARIGAEAVGGGPERVRRRFV